jgi:hypothetical protein
MSTVFSTLFTALRFVREVLVSIKLLFAGGPGELCATLDAREFFIGTCF